MELSFGVGGLDTPPMEDDSPAAPAASSGKVDVKKRRNQEPAEKVDVKKKRKEEPVEKVDVKKKRNEEPVQALS